MRLARRFTEDRSRLYAAEVALAIHHLHQNDIIYRDLKLENVLVDSEGHVALTDFGMSKENMSKDARTSTFVGTYQMMAPEVFSGKSYSRAVDWWALGVMVFEMIDGRTPFNAKTNRLIKERIVNVDVKFSPRFNDEVKDFVCKLLTKDETERLGSGVNGFEQLKSHPWFKGIDWEAVGQREVQFEGQEELMKSHAKEFTANDIFDTYINSTEVTVDTPVSVKSNADEEDEELFEDFAFNYMAEEDDEDDAEQSVEAQDNQKEDEQEEEEKEEDATTVKYLDAEVHEEALESLFLSRPASQFDIGQLRPHQASDFEFSTAIEEEEEEVEKEDEVAEEYSSLSSFNSNSNSNSSRNSNSYHTRKEKDSAAAAAEKQLMP